MEMRRQEGDAYPDPKDMFREVQNWTSYPSRRNLYTFLRIRRKPHREKST